MSKPLSVRDIDAKKRPVETRVRMCIDGHLIAEIQACKEQLAVAKSQDTGSAIDGSVHDLELRILDLEAEARTLEVEFVFQGLGRKAWTDLILAHPATEDQREDNPDIDYDLTTFPAAAMHAACVSPADGDLAWWQQFNEEWNVGEINRVWTACLGAQHRVADAPKAPSTGSEAPRGSARN